MPTSTGTSPAEEPSPRRSLPRLRARRLGIDTGHVPVIYLRQGCEASLVEGLVPASSVLVSRNGRALVAELNMTSGDIVGPEEAGLSEAAWGPLGVDEGDTVTVCEAQPAQSMAHVRAKIGGRRLRRAQVREIIEDIVLGRYSELEMAAFVTACAARRLTRTEVVSLTRCMVEAGTRLTWDSRIVADKHCVGGLPGNRTTMLVVPIVAAAGLVIPKTSSRAITSPAGTADTMEVITRVMLDLPTMRRVVEREGGCIAWGGAMHLSPADDVLIRVERPLELDAPGQLVASVLSKKAAAGSTHVIIDIPVGTTAKVRNASQAHALALDLVEVGRSVGLTVKAIVTDGSQPVGRGVGPALEARDVLSVLRNEPGAPEDLRDRSLRLAGALFDLTGVTVADEGIELARAVLADGRAWQKMRAICEAQGGFWEPGLAPHRAAVRAREAGRVETIDNHALARLAKIAGAPEAKLSGLEILVKSGDAVSAGQELMVVHSEAEGDLERALAFGAAHPDIVTVVPE